MTISKKIRDRILVESNHCCCRCFNDSPEVDIHHIIPQSEGGSDDYSNLIVLCPNCHRLAHRYKFTKYQLELYKKRTTDMAYSTDWYGRYKLKVEQKETYTMLKRLLVLVTDWYNDYVEIIASILTSKRKNNKKLDKKVFEYIWSRRYLNEVISIQKELVEKKEFLKLVNDIEVFVRLLASIDPLTGTYCCDVKPYWNQTTMEIAKEVYSSSEKKSFYSTERVKLLNSLQIQLEVIIQEVNNKNC